jgi:hypothetical protein
LATQVIIDKDAKHIADLVWQFSWQACSAFPSADFPRAKRYNVHRNVGTTKNPCWYSVEIVFVRGLYC